MADPVWLAKQGWAARLRASRLPIPAKYFAWVVFDGFAHGTKLDCFPSTGALLEAGGWSSDSGFKGWRDALVGCGAITAELDHHTKSGKGWENYLYRINLDWDGSVPPEFQTKPRGQKPKPKPPISTKDKSPLEFAKAQAQVQVPIADAQPEQAAEPPEVTSTPQRRAIDPKPWTTEELAAETPEPDPVETLRRTVREQVGRTDEVDDLLSCIPEEYRSEYAERLYGHVLDTRHLTGNTLTPVLCEWLESDGRPVGKLALRGW